DLLIEAAKAEPSLRVVVIGEGPDRERLERLAAEVNGRIEFTGRVDDERLADLYARCVAVYYAPIDEDFGMVPYEAFLSEKPVVTTTDAGGPLEIVRDRETGVVVAPEPAELARACTYLATHADEARAWGRAGPLRRVLQRLMRWYVEPVLAEQRAFNGAVLKLYDELDERLSRLERPKRRAAAGVRIAVCRPQVPFVHGGAEVVADVLVDEL